MDSNLDKKVVAYTGSLYDFDNKIQMNWYPQRILNFISNKESLLELGLGHGITTNFFSNHFKKHIVLDASKAVIDNFKKEYPDCKAQIIETYFEQFQTSEKYHVIMMGFILEHVDNPIQIMSYYKQFLSPIGKMFITVPNAEVLNRRLGYLAGMLPDIMELSENDILVGHKRYFTVKSLREDIKAAGYEIELIEGIYLKPFTTPQMISLNFDSKILDALCKVGVDYPELCCGILAQIK
jgi:2-polyprenyl-3-methyl-5-hydroxy-6-metoxy-1,4-benzoquinol methylase